MATTTRMKVTSSAQIYHRVGATGDMASHDVGTSDAKAAGLGGQGDFQIDSDETVDIESNHQIVNASESALDATGNASNLTWVCIKHTGFTSSAKTEATTSTVTIGVGGTFANGGFTLAAGESITLHGLGGGCDRLGDFQADSSSGDVYMEITFQDA